MRWLFCFLRVFSLCSLFVRLQSVYKFRENLGSYSATTLSKPYHVETIKPLIYQRL